VSSGLPESAEKELSNDGKVELAALLDQRESIKA
jgi:hypothetical protein